MTNQTILITGSAGFIGFHTAKRLLETGNTVIGVDNFNDYYDQRLKESRNAILEEFPNFKLERANVADYPSIAAVFQNNRIDKICHLAAQAGVRYSLTNPFVYEESNLKGFLNMLECARNYGVKDFIYASSSSVYGNNAMAESGFSENDAVDTPISLYAATKKANELMAYTYHHLYGINCTGLRFFTVYGPWGRPDMALFLFTGAILEGRTIELYNYGEMLRDFTYVDDIVSGVISSLERAYPYEIFNLGNSETVTLKRFLETIESELGRKAIVSPQPIQPGDVPKTFADIGKAQAKLGFSPQTNIESGVKRFIAWYKTYYEIN